MSEPFFQGYKMIADEPLPSGRGRPSFEPTGEQRRAVTDMAAVGITQEQISLYLGIDDNTLRKHFRRELDVSALEANVKVAKSLYVKAISGDIGAAVWWTKSRMGWKEKQDLQHSGGINLNVVTGIDRGE